MRRFKTGSWVVVLAAVLQLAACGGGAADNDVSAASADSNLNRSATARATALALTTSARTFHVATTGIDANDRGTSDKPFKTIRYGISRLQSGDTLIVAAGTYSGKENFINDRLGKIPSGTASAYTAILAVPPYSVRIEHEAAGLGYTDNLLRLDGSRVRVDGFVFNLENNVYPPYNASINGDRNKVTRSIFRRAGKIDSYGGWLEINGSYNLLEDAAGVGAVRYGFKTGGTDSSASYNIFRRVVGRSDYTNSREPKSTFAHYGNNSEPGASHHIVFQNCISLDGLQGSHYGNPFGFKYGGIGVIKAAKNDVLQGNIVLNEESEYSGIWIDGDHHRLQHNIIWHTRRGAYGGTAPIGLFKRSTAGPDILASHTTSGKNEAGAQSANMAQDSSDMLADTAPKYLVRPDAGSAGATVLRRYGRSGTLYGEEGWDELTTESLWPWAHEVAIKKVFAEANTPPAGSTPAINDTLRGFAAAQDAYGQPMTLTRYVWQYTGNRIPDTVYGGDSGGPGVPPPGQYMLVVSRTGPGKVMSKDGRIDCGSDCSEAYAAGATIGMNAIPDAGKAFVGWGGSCAGTSPYCSVKLSRSKGVTATFR
jgi:hypothetical protein